MTGILGNGNGKAGTAVFKKGKAGRMIVSAYQPNVANPKTERQQENRLCQTLATGLARAINFRVLKPYLTPSSDDNSPYNDFVSQLGRLATKLQEDNAIEKRYIMFDEIGTMVRSDLRIARGNKTFEVKIGALVPPTAVTDTNFTAVLTFENQLIGADDKTDDQFIALAWNVTKQTAVKETILKERNAANVTTPYVIEMPVREVGDMVVVYLFARYQAPNNGGSKWQTSDGIGYIEVFGDTATPITTRVIIPPKK